MSTHHSTVYVDAARLEPQFNCTLDGRRVRFQLVDPTTELFDTSQLFVAGTPEEILDLAVRLADAVTTYTQDQRGAA